MIWTSLAERVIYAEDREQCFRWFAEVGVHVNDHACIRACFLLLPHFRRSMKSVLI